VAACDVGLVPFLANALTDAMLPIKVFDYAAARKPVVSTALGAYAGEDLPFLRTAPATPEGFAEAVLTALRDGWTPAWDAAVDRYDWGRLAGTLEELLADPGAKRAR
jgi:glycosyltransferase involved in cell wall biosynthesis